MENRENKGSNTKPSYSVLMAVYKKDNPEWFDIALDSMIRQTMPPSEIVIVVDGPITDALEKVIIQKRKNNSGLIKCVRLKTNQGLGEALRVGVLSCTNEWIVRMDSDDYSLPERCEIQFMIQAQYQADIVGCNVDEFIGTPDHVVAKRVFPEKHEEIIAFGKRRTPFAHPAVIMKKSQVLAAGNYRTAYLYEDYDLFVRMLMAGCISRNIAKPLVCMRVNSDFYARRGGIKYLVTLLRFNIYMQKIGWMSHTDFAVRSVANIISCLIPNRLRDWVYKKLLRK